MNLTFKEKMFRWFNCIDSKRSLKIIKKHFEGYDFEEVPKSEYVSMRTVGVVNAALKLKIPHSKPNGWNHWYGPKVFVDFVYNFQQKYFYSDDCY